MIVLKSPRELELMRKAGSIVARILEELAAMIKPGISTGELNSYAESRCKDLKARPSFLGYRDFPASLCISINDEIVHGIPSDRRLLKEGDIVSLDFGACYESWHGDSACTVPVGSISKEAERLIDVTRESLKRGIQQCVEGYHVSDIGNAIQNYVEPFGYSVVREFVGHGIGRTLHEEPQIPNFGQKGRGVQLKVGMVLAIEPMINAGGHEVRVLGDGWTAVTADHSLSAHFEHTVAITPDGAVILTEV
ncbi:MAG: type I methionyl aminopeptidase [Bdellovibrionota bacterium]